MARRAHELAPLERYDVREAFERFGALVHGAAKVMAARTGAPSADDITVAAFVALAGEEWSGDGETVLGRLLRLAGRAANDRLLVG